MEIVRRGNQRNGKNYRDDLIVFYKRAGTDGEPGNIIYGKKFQLKASHGVYPFFKVLVYRE